MKISISPYIKIAILFLSLIFTGKNIKCQSPMPDILSNGTLKEQLVYIEERTRIYDNYRAVREDMFQMIKNNSIDSLSAIKMEFSASQNNISILNSKIDSLKITLDATYARLDEMTTTKNSIAIFGIEVNKVTYNTITWILIAGLLSLLAIGFLSFKRNLIISTNTKKELKELEEEFETYRQSTRIAREKMSMVHFNELKRLKEQ